MVANPHEVRSVEFQVRGLDATRFEHLYRLDDTELARRGVVALVADEQPGFPCRVSLADAEPGRRMLLLNHEYQPADTPYRGRHAIFVAQDARTACPEPGEVPDMLGRRLLSVRAFEHQHMMRDARMVDGRDASAAFRDLLGDPDTAYLHVHTAARGCYLAQVERIPD